MALESISLTDIINTPQITPGLGGWDAIINSFIQNEVGRHRFGLLSRLVSVSPTSSGLNLLVVPAGWKACPVCVLIEAATASDPGTPEITLGMDSQSDGDNWLPGGSNDVGMDNLTGQGSNQKVALLFPFPAAHLFPASYSTSYVAPGLPVCDGDEDTGQSSRYFSLDVTSGSFAAPVNISTFGFVWPKDDA